MIRRTDPVILTNNGWEGATDTSATPSGFGSLTYLQELYPCLRSLWPSALKVGRFNCLFVLMILPGTAYHSASLRGEKGASLRANKLCASLRS